MSLNPNKIISSVVIDGINVHLVDGGLPEGYVKPEGEMVISEEGDFDVTNIKLVKCRAPFEPKFEQLINGTLTEITAEDLKGATKVNDYAFYKQQNLAKVELPSTIQEIGQQSFSGCSNLITINLKNIKTIGTDAFYSCNNLNKIEISGTVGNNSFGKCGLITLILNEGVTYLPINCFAGCFSLMNIYIPITLKKINDFAFHLANKGPIRNLYVKDIDKFAEIDWEMTYYNQSWSNNLVNIYLNNELVENLVLGETNLAIGNINFMNSTLKTAYLPDTLTIKVDAFKNSKSLIKVEMNKIATIKRGAFNGCTALTEIIINKSCTVAEDVPILENTNAIPSTAYVYVPDATTQSLYQSATNWSTMASRIKLTSELQ